MEDLEKEEEEELENQDPDSDQVSIPKVQIREDLPSQ